MPDQNPADPTAPGPLSSFSNLDSAAEPPPSMDSSDLPPAPPIVEPAPPEAPPVGDTGGATPTFDISSSISGTPPPKKKFGGRRFVATILGLLVLVGGLGAGIILVQQQQDIRERAKATECGTDSDCPSGYSCKAGLCQPKSTPTPTKTPTPTRVPTPTSTPTQTPSPPPSNACTKAGGQCYNAHNCTFDVGRPPVNGGSGCGNISQVCCQPGGVITPTPTPTCIADTKCIGPGDSCCGGKSYFDASCSLTETRCGTKPGGTPTPTPSPTGGGQCSRVSQVFTDHNATSITVSQAMMNACTSNCSDGKLWVSRYKCNGINLSQGCQDNGEVLTWDAKVGQTFSTSSPTCGTIQIDLGCKNTANTYGNVGGVSKGAAQACSTPTNPPGPPTAQCLNVRAFDINWTELKVAQLSQLKAGDKVRFTVGGTTSGGSFDKAKFKINGVERPEVTAKKPASQDFYDEYAIPEGVTTFTINAQIHHATLGWSN